MSKRRIMHGISEWCVISTIAELVGSQKADSFCERYSVEKVPGRLCWFCIQKGCWKCREVELPKGVRMI